MSEAIIAAVIVAIVGPVVLYLLNRVFSKPKDSTDMVQTMQEIANQAIEDLHREKTASMEKDKLREQKYQAMREEFDQLKNATYGPFRVTFEFTTNPPKISNIIIEVVPVDDKAKAKTS